MDFNAETVITTLAEVFEKHGKPKTLTFDRDTRFVNSWTGRDYPSALLRFLTCLGIVPNVCPAHHPEKNGFVERYNKTYEYECLQIHRPQSQTAVAELNPQFREHYNQERPNQAITCHNQPPRLAFPNLPELPRLPDYVDPDGWLHAIDGKHTFGELTLQERSRWINTSTTSAGLSNDFPLHHLRFISPLPFRECSLHHFYDVD